VPRKIRQLVSDLELAGFYLVPGGKGSHRKFRHPKMRGSLAATTATMHYIIRKSRFAEHCAKLENESGR
jgi:predicted RNA binding protein YcfA (HicA-like mRNA interferase family)